MTLRQLVRYAMDTGELDHEVIIRVLRRTDNGTYAGERHVSIARVSGMLASDKVMIVVEEEELNAAQMRNE